MKRALWLLALLAGAPGQAGAAEMLRYFCSGGVTGAGGGVSVDADGSVSRLSMSNYASAVLSTPVPGQPQPVADWARTLEQAGFRRIPSGAPGNMTCTLALITPEGRHAIRWAGGSALPSTWPEEVRQVTVALRALLAARP